MNEERDPQERAEDRPGAGVRVERDSLGETEVPADAYWGVHTARALANYRITGTDLSRHAVLIEALAAVKEAAAEANRRLGRLDGERADAIVAACREIRGGHWHDQFPLDPLQGGAGTSTNMVANEVIANRALELLGHARGRYDLLDPIDHVNLGQSTNDVYPTAVRLALIEVTRRLSDGVARLADAFGEKADEFRDVITMGRTQLQDAVPITLGRQMAAYRVMLLEECDRLAENEPLLGECNLGGTAIGTGLNGHPDYPQLVCDLLADLVGAPVTSAGDLVEATQDCGVFVQLSGAYRRTAVKLSKICNDLRLMSSGPQCGLGEITLPAMAAGSSIMPGKVNPVIPEVVNQVAFTVIGGDLTVTMAAEAGQLQLNAFEPVIAHTLLTSAGYLTRAMDTLAQRCVLGIGTDPQRLARAVDRSSGLATALAPVIGYAAAARLAKDAVAQDRPVLDLAVEQGMVEVDTARDLLSPQRLVHPLAGA